MTGPCIVVDPAETRRKDVVRIMTSAGLSGIVETTDPERLHAALNNPVPLRVAVVAITDPPDLPLSLLSKLRVGQPDCLLLAIDDMDTEDSAARSFSAGAHDALRLPFRPVEFETRLALGLTRITPEKARVEDAANALITRLDLTQAEARVLRVLAARQGQIVTRDELSRHLDGKAWSYGDRRFDVHITRIRRKLRNEIGEVFALRTVRSAGYTLEFTGLAEA